MPCAAEDFEKWDLILKILRMEVENPPPTAIRLHWRKTKVFSEFNLKVLNPPYKIGPSLPINTGGPN